MSYTTANRRPPRHGLCHPSGVRTTGAPNAPAPNIPYRKHHETTITQPFPAALRSNPLLGSVQRRRQRQAAEALGLRHLHGRLQNPVRKIRSDSLEKRAGTLRPDRRHEQRLGLLRLGRQRHGLHRGLRTAGRRDRRQGLGERRAEIHRCAGFGQRLPLLGLGRERQPLCRRQRGRGRRPDGQNLERRRRGLRLLGEPRRIAGPGP